MSSILSFLNSNPIYAAAGMGVFTGALSAGSVLMGSGVSYLSGHGTSLSTENNNLLIVTGSIISLTVSIRYDLFEVIHSRENQDSEVLIHRDAFMRGDNMNIIRQIYTGRRALIASSSLMAHHIHSSRATMLSASPNGEDYFKMLISKQLDSLTEKEDKDNFIMTIQNREQEVYLELTRIAVQNLISSPNPLTKENTCNFMHSYLEPLENLRLKQKKLQEAKIKNETSSVELSHEIKNGCDTLTLLLIRNASCVESLNGAFKFFDPMDAVSTA